MKTTDEDLVMPLVRQWFEDSGLTLQQLGDRMGWPAKTARASAWQFLRSGSPQINILRRFAAAAEISLSDLVEGRLPKSKKRKT